MVEDSLERVKATFFSQVQSLDSLVSDWASWDQTDLFIRNHDDALGALNIVGDNFASTSKIDLLLIYSVERELAHGFIFNQDSKNLEKVDSNILNSIGAHQVLFDNKRKNQGRKGIIQSGNQYFIIAAQTISESNNENPTRGTLMMGSILDKNKVAQLQKLTRTSIKIKPVEDGSTVTADLVDPIMKPKSSINISIQSNDIIEGSTVLNDISGKPILQLSIELNRTIHQQSRKLLYFIIQAIVIIGIIFGLVFFFFIDIIISRRLTTIISDIGEIEKNPTQGQRVTESRLKDELGKLGVSINRMLEANEALEAYKAQNKKLEGLATFSAGASHELSTPLSAIAVASGEILHGLLFDTTDEDELYDDIFLIREQVSRCKYILNQMGADAGEHMGEEIRSFSIKELIEDTQAFFQKTVENHIQVDNKISDHLVTMPFLSLRRVLRGIINNSADASQDGETILLSCYEDSTHLIFETRDQGKGMDDDTLKNAIDPFFTTKKFGNNIGLGLYLAQSLAGRFGGSLDITSKPNFGTTVTLSLSKEKVYA